MWLRAYNQAVLYHHGERRESPKNGCNLSPSTNNPNQSKDLVEIWKEAAKTGAWNNPGPQPAQISSRNEGDSAALCWLLCLILSWLLWRWVKKVASVDLDSACTCRVCQGPCHLVLLQDNTSNSHSNCCPLIWSPGAPTNILNHYLKGLSQTFSYQEEFWCIKCYFSFSHSKGGGRCSHLKAWGCNFECEAHLSM